MSEDVSCDVEDVSSVVSDVPFEVVFDVVFPLPVVVSFPVVSVVPSSVVVFVSVVSVVSVPVCVSVCVFPYSVAVWVLSVTVDVPSFEFVPATVMSVSCSPVSFESVTFLRP